MTLLLTEIHPGTAPFVVFAADRRISSTSGAQVASEPKIFKLPSQRAGIGYYGLAEMPAGTGRQPMAKWVQDFLQSHSGSMDLQQLAKALCEALNAVVPQSWQQTEISGFHLAGFAADGEPEFWFVRNVDDDRHTLLGSYQMREDFRTRRSTLPPDGIAFYRNGDIRAHVAAWEHMDTALGPLVSSPGFAAIGTHDDYVMWVRFKLETIARFYEAFSLTSIIGLPVDAFYID